MTKGQIKPKADWRAADFPKKRTNGFFFTPKKPNKFVCWFFGRSKPRKCAYSFI